MNSELKTNVGFCSLELRLSRNTFCKPKLVLSLDSGGVKGIFQAKLLSLIMHDNPKVKFDLICGTSIGAFVGGLVAYKLNSPDTYFTKENLDIILDKSLLDKLVGVYQLDSVYDGKGKTKMIRKIFGNLKLSQSKIPLVVVSYNLTTLEPKIYSSWETPDEDFGLVLDGSSATPVYFPPISNGDLLYTDGGVCMNNPSILGISKARQLYPYTDVKVLSIGTGLKPNFDSKLCKLKWGAAGWIDSGLIDLLLDGPAQMNNIIAKEMIGSNYYRLDSKDISDIDLDDTSKDSYDHIIKTAEIVYQIHKDKLASFLS